MTWITRKWETTPNAGTSRRVSGVVSAAQGSQGRKSVACLSVCSWLGPSTVVRSPSDPSATHGEGTAHSQKGGAGRTSDRETSVHVKNVELDKVRKIECLSFAFFESHRTRVSIKQSEGKGRRDK